jgi:hypothetical protein
MIWIIWVYKKCDLFTMKCNLLFIELLLLNCCCLLRHGYPMIVAVFFFPPPYIMVVMGGLAPCSSGPPCHHGGDEWFPLPTLWVRSGLHAWAVIFWLGRRPSGVSPLSFPPSFLLKLYRLEGWVILLLGLCYLFLSHSPI